MSGVVSINTHLNGFLSFISVFDIEFLLIIEIWHDVQKGSGSTLRSMSCQKLAVYPAISELVDLYPNLLWNSSREIIFLGFSFVVLTFLSYFLCMLCDNVTELYSSALNKTIQKTFWKMQICPKSINVIMENNWLHKYGANITLYNVAIKGLPLLSWMFIWTSPVFSLWWNTHLQLQCIYPFLLVSPVQNLKLLVSCDKLRLNLKYNW